MDEFVYGYATHLAHPEGCAALCIVLVTVLRVSRSCERFQDEFDLHLLPRVKIGFHDARSNRVKSVPKSACRAWVKEGRYQLS